MKKAVIDIGTNSVKLCIGEEKQNKLTIYKDTNTITKLGEKMATDGKMTEQAIERTSQSVKNYVKEAKADGANEISIVGTMALREAKNANDLKKRIKELTNIDVRTLSGQEEATLSYKAAISDIKIPQNQDTLIFDTGGGSTEFIYGKNGTPTEQTSINIGAVRITEKYFSTLPITKEELEKAIKEIKQEILNGKIQPKQVQIIGLGGNVTSMSAMKMKLEKYDAEKVQGSKLTKEEVTKQTEQLSSMTVEEIRQIKGLNPKRAEIILAGATIVRAIMEINKANEITICDRGLRQELLK
ncbi:MAG: Ppx/GppA phosphatase family protein [Synergistaceae bacterium]